MGNNLLIFNVIILNWIFLGFGWLITQKNKFEYVNMGSENFI